MSITSNRIKEIRLSRGITQEELAKLVGMKNKSSISKIENPSKNTYKKDRDITISQVEKFAKALNTTVNYLMGWTNNPDLTREQDKNTQILAADTASLDGKPIIIASDTIDKTQQHRNALADKIRNSDYTNEQLDKIEKMIDLMI